MEIRKAGLLWENFDGIGVTGGLEGVCNVGGMMEREETGGRQGGIEAGKGRIEAVASGRDAETGCHSGLN